MFSDTTATHDNEAETGSHRCPVARRHVRYLGPNIQSSPNLTIYRSIVAAVIRLVLAFQSQVAGLGTPTDIDRKSPISPLHYLRRPTRLIPHPLLEALTSLLYWNFLEAGISLIASNLPSIYFLIKNESLQSFANSVRNVVSLESLRSSKRSNSDTEGQALYPKKRNASKTSHVTTAAKKEWEALEGVNTFAMSDMKRGVRVKKPEAVHAAGNVGEHGDMV